MRPVKDRNVKAPPSGIAKKVYKGRDKSVKRTGQLHHVLKEKELPAVQHSPAQRLDPSTKIKLQLFPIDEVTRLGLQKDGHHPYLELTLKAQKRISSVVKHLQTKWGSSTIATGEPVLYPYSIEEAKSSPDRWTLDDKDVSAGDVHAAIGSPTLFRLRYGWFSNAGSESLGKSSKWTPAKSLNPASFLTKYSHQHEGIQKGCESNINSKCDEGRKFEKADSEVTKTVGGVKDHEIMVDNLVDHPVDRMNTVECNEGGLGQSSEIWTDNLTNISIGGLLSEASLQGMFSSFLSKTNGCVPTSHFSQCTSDSFDALITTHVKHSQSKKLSTNEPCSSILDAEDTCMAFPFKKSSMSKDISTSNGSSSAGLSCTEIGARPCQFLKAAEDDIQIKIEPETFNADAFQESETALQLCSRVYNDESSLGLAGIQWTDTLGPFDLGLPSGKVINGDTISISGFVR
ncbi:TSL-kinase interacting protein 1 isoform X2 [Syzygium oleosum]|uniref:TSL-kinase interacting protein 1 isoform X2 n=1 Tax=Syzygium oleosum TaxID=219896 RepID=UPI0011D28AAC|nr:TSL-kinase interacting protein 1 isoform X2 [Syzygium oleosum]